MKVISIRPDGGGDVEVDGVTQSVQLGLVPNAAIGDYVIVHAGFAIEMLDRDEADARLALFAELAAVLQSGAP